MHLGFKYDPPPAVAVIVHEFLFASCSRNRRTLVVLCMHMIQSILKNLDNLDFQFNERRVPLMENPSWFTNPWVMCTTWFEIEKEPNGHARKNMPSRHRFASVTNIKWMRHEESHQGLYAFLSTSGVQGVVRRNQICSRSFYIRSIRNGTTVPDGHSTGGGCGSLRAIQVILEISGI